MSYKLLNYSLSPSETPRAGLLLNGKVVDMRDASNRTGLTLPGETILQLIQSWDISRPVLEKIAEAHSGNQESLAVSEVTLHAPLLYPGAIFCTAGNYSDHIKEMDHGYEIDKTKTRPYFFHKAPPDRSIVGQEQSVAIPSHSSKLDWEAEFAFIIGREAKNVNKEDAMDYVAGYTIINDLSARDHLFREDWPQFKTDWFGQKCFDQSVPMGPWITPADQIPDTSDLSIKLWLNGELKQDTGTRYMIFNVAEQIEALSKQITLKPGDLVATGTGSGVGGALASSDHQYLKSGDVMKISVEGIGDLETNIV